MKYAICRIIPAIYKIISIFVKTNDSTAMKRILSVLSCLAAILAISCDPEENTGGGNDNKEKVVEVQSISLSPWDNYVMMVGSVVGFSAYPTPKNANPFSVTWKSSDTKVATVDKDGNVKAVGAGVVKISATAGNGVKGELNVTVYYDGEIAIFWGKSEDVTHKKITVKKGSEQVFYVYNYRTRDYESPGLWFGMDKPDYLISDGLYRTYRYVGYQTESIFYGAYSVSCGVDVVE